MAENPVNMTMENVRAQFDVFTHQPDLVYLDSASSAQKPRVVLNAVRAFEEHSYANIHRGLYDLSQKATTAYEAARQTVADFIGANSADNIIFTRNTTESINLLAWTWGFEHLSAGDAILISELEHHANIVPWQMLREILGFEIIVAPITDNGELTLEAVEKCLSAKVKLVAITAMSNALGTVTPVTEITRAAHAMGAKVLIDATQAVVHGSVNVQAWGADFIAFTGHKLYGPTGIGVLYGKSELLAAMPPFLGGGDMIETVTFERSTFAPAPAKFEAGTPNITGAVGLAAALEFMQTLGLENIAEHEAKLFSMLQNELKKLPFITLIGKNNTQAALQSFNVNGCSASDVAMILDKHHLALRSGHHCCMPLMGRLGIASTLRASLGVYSTEADIEKLLIGLHKAHNMLT